MAWLREEGFGGIMIWSVDMDDFRGSCSSGKYPLINAMRQELEGYKVKLEFNGPYETNIASGQYTTKNRKYNIILSRRFSTLSVLITPSLVIIL